MDYSSVIGGFGDTYVLEERKLDKLIQKYDLTKRNVAHDGLEDARLVKELLACLKPEVKGGSVTEELLAQSWVRFV